MTPGEAQMLQLLILGLCLCLGGGFVGGILLLLSTDLWLSSRRRRKPASWSAMALMGLIGALNVLALYLISQYSPWMLLPGLVLLGSGLWLFVLAEWKISGAYNVRCTMTPLCYMSSNLGTVYLQGLRRFAGEGGEEYQKLLKEITYMDWMMRCRRFQQELLEHGEPSSWTRLLRSGQKGAGEALQKLEAHDNQSPGRIIKSICQKEENWPEHDRQTLLTWMLQSPHDDLRQDASRRIGRQQHQKQQSMAMKAWNHLRGWMQNRMSPPELGR